MTRHIATALLLGMGIAGEAPDVRAGESPSSLLPARRLHPPCRALTQATEFGHLKSAGRFRRAEIAALFIDDGTLYAEWTGQVDARQPRRIETEELDAEWMAHTAPADKWFLTRRELVDSEGRICSIQIYGDRSDPADVQLVAIVKDGAKNVQ